MSQPLPENESERLNTLRGYQILDTHPEDRFDDLTRLAASICRTPISLISLVDEDRQWFKSKIGVDMCETSREEAFCAHAIMSPELLVVPDASHDPRFAANPLVRGKLHIRFYAGAPLTAPNGHHIGALCVIDRVPR
ncbi:MAG TPA: GAF domain-containing protein, partial [Verrucomicrobiae bacterium]